MDILSVAIFAATFAALVGGYAVWGAIGRALASVQLATDTHQTRPVARDGGRFVGGSDKPGSN